MESLGNIPGMELLNNINPMLMIGMAGLAALLRHSNVPLIVATWVPFVIAGATGAGLIDPGQVAAGVPWFTAAANVTVAFFFNGVGATLGGRLLYQPLVAVLGRTVEQRQP